MAAGHGLPRHVWVIDAGDASRRAPGLLVEWRCSPSTGWEARTVHVVVRGDDVVLEEEWLPAERVAPA